MKKPKAGRPKGSGSTAVLTRGYHVKLPPELFERMNAAAQAERRPLANWVRLILENATRSPTLPRKASGANTGETTS
jgi:hypothetical protein